MQKYHNYKVLEKKMVTFLAHTLVHSLSLSLSLILMAIFQVDLG